MHGTVWSFLCACKHVVCTWHEGHVWRGLRTYAFVVYRLLQLEAAVEHCSQTQLRSVAAEAWA